MDLQQYSKTIDGKEIHYFVNDKGANIEVVKIEPNTFSWCVVYCTVDLYINIYNDDFTRKVSFMVENLSTGIEGESWFEDEEEADYEPTEEDSWAQTLDYLSLDDPYDAWDGYRDFWNTFNKYNEDLDEDPALLFAYMIDDDRLKEWCSPRFSRKDRAVFDFEISKPASDLDFNWEGKYKGEGDRFVERPVFIGLKKTSTERKAVRTILLDNYFVNECLEKVSYNSFRRDHEGADYEKLNVFVGEWLVNLWGCARQGRLVGDYVLGGYDLPDWEDDTTVDLLRFWKLTDVKTVEINDDKSYTAFYSGERCWLINDDLEDREKDFYPLIFSFAGDLPNTVVEIRGELTLPGEEKPFTAEFPVEVTAIESRIIDRYCEYVTYIDKMPDELYSKLVTHLQQAYLDYVKDTPNAVKSIEELDKLDCSYYFPDLEDE